MGVTDQPTGELWNGDMGKVNREPRQNFNHIYSNFLNKSLPVQSFDNVPNTTMKFLWLYKNNDHAKMASTATLSLDLALFSCSRFPSFKFIQVIPCFWPALVMSLSNALENETANKAFWLHKLYALPGSSSYLKCRPFQKKTSCLSTAHESAF